MVQMLQTTGHRYNDRDFLVTCQLRLLFTITLCDHGMSYMIEQHLSAIPQLQTKVLTGGCRFPSTILEKKNFSRQV